MAKKKESQVEIRTTLSAEEMQRINDETLKEHTRKLMQEVADLKLQLKSKDIEALKLKLEVESKNLELLQREKLEMLQKLNEERANHRTFVTELKNKLNIKSDRWGYNPLTGEIIE